MPVSLTCVSAFGTYSCQASISCPSNPIVEGCGGRCRTPVARAFRVTFIFTHSIPHLLPQLQNYAVRELVYDAVQLASRPPNETASRAVLEFISSRLMQVRLRVCRRRARSTVVHCVALLTGQHSFWLPSGTQNHPGGDFEGALQRRPVSQANANTR
jgi:hypothetical protein